ncbi:lipid IV(A) palmitoyltransferase PagP [Rahnella sp. Larv3_ips]|uniref:lipid IV(A) palmitoyltransferase PagP n=1 Tax=Rahnella sp. Larv3_ips TaxID=1896943 RepID=UPI000EFCAFD8|nr:lipid IV(A) palmitoyltransferase PagP [Rahnella sp. Larv3_ips]
MSINKLICYVGVVLSLGLSSPVWATNSGVNPTSTPNWDGKESIFPGMWDTFKENVAETWNAPQAQDVYLPVITWHNRLTYDKEKTDKYNERPWGGGYGISRYDDKGNWHGIYFMAFKDSHNKWEPIGGYGWEKIWTPAEDKNFRVGLGYTAAVTARDDYEYIPIPIVLPLASVGYNKLTFQATYIPGTYNNGNVFFAWLRYQF